MKRTIFLPLIILISVNSFSQSNFLRRFRQIVVPTKDKLEQEFQVLRGKIVNKATQYPLAGATVLLYNDSLKRIGTASNEDGTFSFERLNVGRYRLEVSFVGYGKFEQSELLNASSEIVLDIALEETPLELDSIIVSQTTIEPVGSYTINTNELSKYAGNRGEAIRKVSVLPGILSADDSRNDIVIRGNSPGSVIWRLEGVNIPNPNHFSIPGTTGGPVTMINDKMLTASEFYSGAFPAEFGNTTSGLFNLRFRNGNTSKHESNFQFGLLGVELSSEGPLANHESSYLFSIRRSTIGAFKNLIDIGTGSTPRYTDGSFKLNFKRKKSSFSVFGLGGLSDINILISKGVTNVYGEKDRDQYFNSGSGVMGFNFNKSIDSLTYLTSTLAFSNERVNADHYLVYSTERVNLINQNNSGALPFILSYDFKMRRLSHAFHLTKKSKQFQSTFHAGVSSDFYLFNYLDSVRNFDPSSSNFNTWHVRWNNKSTAWLIQPFFQWNHWFQNLDVQVGIHTQYFSLSNSISYAEPRAALKYYLGERQNFYLGFGLHSQMQTPYLYFFRRAGEGNNNAFLNKGMDFTRSRHFVLGYERFFGDEKVKWRLKTEVYHQYLYDVPVDSLPTSFSLLNSGATFTRIYKESFINKGKGENYGVEVTIDKTFSKGYLFLLTSSLFQSTYSGSDGIWRDTEFNGSYIVNSLFTKEWTTRKSNIVSLGMRQSLAGGRRYGYIDTEASNGLQEVVFKDDGYNTLQFRPYIRADIRFSYKWNYSKSVTHELAIDFINFLNIKNVLKMIYVPDKIQDNKPQFVEEYQLGRLPFFYYRWSF